MMKKILTLFLFLTVSVSVFAQTSDYSDDKYDELIKQGDYEAVIASVTETKESDFSASDCFYLGLSYFSLEDDARAQKYLKLAVKKAPDYIKAYDYLAGSYFFSGKNDDALTYYQKCILLDSEYFHAYKMIGQIYEQKGDLEKAYENYVQYYQLHQSADSSYFLGKILYEFGEYEDAKAYIEFCVKENKDNFNYNLLMVGIYYALEDYDNAMTYKTKLHQIWEKSEDEEIKSIKSFFLFALTYGEYEIEVFEKLDRTESVYNFFSCYVKSNGKVVKRVNLEYNKSKQPYPYTITIDDIKSNMHMTSTVSMDIIPELNVCIMYLQQAVDNELTIAYKTRGIKK